MVTGIKSKLVDLFFMFGAGVTVHAVANELYHKAGYLEILKPQGEWIGIAIMTLAYLYTRFIKK